jgi:hypothetical protein
LLLLQATISTANDAANANLNIVNFSPFVDGFAGTPVTALTGSATRIHPNRVKTLARPFQFSQSKIFFLGAMQ